MKRLEADGKVIITQPGETAEGDSGVYDLAAGKMVLIGNVVLTQGKSVVKGDRLDVDRNTGRVGRDGEHAGHRRRHARAAGPRPVRARARAGAQAEAMTVSVAPTSWSWSGAPRPPHRRVRPSPTARPSCRPGIWPSTMAAAPCCATSP